MRSSTLKSINCSIRVVICLFVLVTTTSCVHSIDKDFEKLYFNKVHIIEEYGKQCCLDTLFVDSNMNNLIEFSEACDYLGSLTGCNFHITYVDIPIYASRLALTSDIAYLKKWYILHGKKMNLFTADSIVEMRLFSNQ